MCNLIKSYFIFNLIYSLILVSRNNICNVYLNVLTYETFHLIYYKYWIMAVTNFVKEKQKLHQSMVLCQV